MAKAVDFDLDKASFSPVSIVIAGCAADIGALWAPILDLRDGPDFHQQIDRLFERLCQDTVSLFPTVLPLLGRLRDMNLKTGIATNDAQANAIAQAGVAGIDRHMDFIAGYDSGHGAKPGPGMIDAFARHCGVPAHRIIMVGDSTHDMAAARNAGAIAVAVATGMADRETLAPHADHVIDDLAELLTLPMLVATAAAAK